MAIELMDIEEFVDALRGEKRDRVTRELQEAIKMLEEEAGDEQ